LDDIARFVVEDCGYGNPWKMVAMYPPNFKPPNVHWIINPM
jgi:hypothetical protein